MTGTVSKLSLTCEPECSQKISELLHLQGWRGRCWVAYLLCVNPPEYIEPSGHVYTPLPWYSLSTNCPCNYQHNYFYYAIFTVHTQMIPQTWHLMDVASHLHEVDMQLLDGLQFACVETILCTVRLTHTHTSSVHFVFGPLARVDNSTWQAVGPRPTSLYVAITGTNILSIWGG